VVAGAGSPARFTAVLLRVRTNWSCRDRGDDTRGARPRTGTCQDREIRSNGRSLIMVVDRHLDGNALAGCCTTYSDRR